jgi:hypothetical protein
MLSLPSEQLKLELSERSDGVLRYHNGKWYEQLYLDEKFKVRDSSGSEMKPFSVGRIYTFLYSDPKYKDILPFYSGFPTGIFIGWTKHKEPNPLFLALWMIPPAIRIQILDKIFKNNEKLIQQNEYNILRGINDITDFDCDYYAIKKYLDGSGFGFAIRSYIIERIETEPKIISWQDAWRINTITNQYVMYKDIMTIYREYNKNIDVKPFKRIQQLIK